MAYCINIRIGTGKASARNRVQDKDPGKAEYCREKAAAGWTYKVGILDRDIDFACPASPCFMVKASL
jgi:hypothetical protein